MSPTNQARPPKYKRSFRNYLIDSRFQLKYTGMILAMAALVSAPLGVFLVKSSREVVEQGARVSRESQKVSDLVKMQIEKDPIYGSDPELAKEFGAASGASDNEVAKQQAALAKQQQSMFVTVVGALALMVMLIGLLGIYITHKVAGPIYKMKMLLRQVGEGKLEFRGGLRKGDELQDFFEEFSKMVEKLRDRQATEVTAIDEALKQAEDSGANETQLAELRKVRASMKAALSAG
jgi:nitrogen fixation/metabolism regulation signal transduction histidine kinase